MYCLIGKIKKSLDMMTTSFNGIGKIKLNILDKNLNIMYKMWKIYMVIRHKYQESVNLKIKIIWLNMDTVHK